MALTAASLVVPLATPASAHLCPVGTDRPQLSSHAPGNVNVVGRNRMPVQLGLREHDALQAAVVGLREDREWREQGHQLHAGERCCMVQGDRILQLLRILVSLGGSASR